jgi:large subunit ribosomal protein L20
MSRVKRAVNSAKKKRKILKMAKSYRGVRSCRFRSAKVAVIHALTYAYRDRRNKKREFRQLWIARINAAARELGVSYSVLIDRLKKADVQINRKILAELAISDKAAFASLVQQGKICA